MQHASLMSIPILTTNNPYHGALDVGFDYSMIVLDFSDTGLDLTQVTPKQGEFVSMTVDANAQQITLENKYWMSKTDHLGYLGITGSNVAALGTFTFTAPTCTAVVQFPTSPPTTPIQGDASCSISVRASNNPWHGALEVGFDISSIVLDFSETGLDLTQVAPQLGEFDSMTVIVSSAIFLTKASWMSKTNPGYLGIGGNNVAALVTFTAPACTAA
jgi:hypothetical protein